MKIVTIGAFGFTEQAFFEALQTAEVDTFCDIRQRRGVRGAAYAFVNSQRLQVRLAELGIRYLHVRELAPTSGVRTVQHAADKATQTAKRQRTELSHEFMVAYQTHVLDPYDLHHLQQCLPAEAKTIALFCVEREPSACHRSLVAQRLAQEWEVEVVHLTSMEP